MDFAEAGIHEAIIYNGDYLYAGMPAIHGPAIIEDAGATIVLLPGMEASVDEYGNIIIEDKGILTQIEQVALNKNITYEII